MLPNRPLFLGTPTDNLSRTISLMGRISSHPVKEKEDLLTRRAYLIRRVYLETAGPKSMPTFLPPQFQGEWALVTYSMSAALTNMAHLYPKTRRETGNC